MAKEKLPRELFFFGTEYNFNLTFDLLKVFAPSRSGCVLVTKEGACCIRVLVFAIPKLTFAALLPCFVLFPVSIRLRVDSLCINNKAHRFGVAVIGVKAVTCGLNALQRGKGSGACNSFDHEYTSGNSCHYGSP
ncbi:MAG: hypothetical protein O2844_04815, partial [Proteobacteria bacterium]|nr:hypothetical protein [Pseudomonadota bacterium]